MSTNSTMEKDLDNFGTIHLCGFIEEDFVCSQWLVKVSIHTEYMLNDGMINIHFHMKCAYQEGKKYALDSACRTIADNRVDWIFPDVNYWTINIDRMIKAMPKLGPAISQFVWAKGDFQVIPEYEWYPEGDYPYNLTISLSPKCKENVMLPPKEIADSLLSFRRDHHNPLKTAFIMMEYGNTPAHKKIVDAIRSTLSAHDIVALRADDKEYHTDLFPNILTYMWGCGFGIAVFERLSDEVFNPNVSLEVGYMLAMDKKVLFLKDTTLRTLHTDLVSKLYISFDPQKVKGTIESQLTNWLKNHIFTT